VEVRKNLGKCYKSTVVPEDIHLCNKQLNVYSCLVKLN